VIDNGGPTSSPPPGGRRRWRARWDYEGAQGVKDGQPKSHLGTSIPSPRGGWVPPTSRSIMEDGQDDSGKLD
jgi:hypothetical protein